MKGDDEWLADWGKTTTYYACHDRYEGECHHKKRNAYLIPADSVDTQPREHCQAPFSSTLLRFLCDRLTSPDSKEDRYACLLDTLKKLAAAIGCDVSGKEPEHGHILGRASGG